jgi:signal transduction histidine kinase
MLGGRQSVRSYRAGAVPVNELKVQLARALLVVLTAAGVICAVLNFQQQRKFLLPEDGVVWIERNHQIQALYVAAGSPAEKAGIRTGDTLLRINGRPIEHASEVMQTLVAVQAWNAADYALQRSGIEFKANVFVAERQPDPAHYYEYAVGVAYLVIGLFVYFRRSRAHKALHFYILCLASFVLFSFHFTGKLNNFDKVIYWGNVIAGLFAPTIFLHFCLTFPAPGSLFRRRGIVSLLYVPASLFTAIWFGITSGVLHIGIPLFDLNWILDRAWMLFVAGMYLAAAIVLAIRYRSAQDAIVRQQFKWLRNGAVLGMLPFTILYVIPYVAGAIPGPSMKMAVLSLPLIPLTWAYAILRYRLMDVDVIFQQGYVYTLATLAVLGIFFALIFSIGRLDDISPAAAVILISIAAFVFQPIRNWIQEQLNRNYFYKDRYDYRRTLIEFGRELGSETDLDRALSSVADRLLRTLSIQHVAFFLADSDEGGGFRLKMAVGADRRGRPFAPGTQLDLSFLDARSDKPYLFFEQTRHSMDTRSLEWPASVRQTIADLDLTYYLPCSVRGRTVAWLGISRTAEGDFLSSDDVELLVTLSGYVGMAVENALLYRSLQQKVVEYERLKEFSENIVESINVGILAADLNDRVESWNSQIERLTGVPRKHAVGRPLAELFPPELFQEFDLARNETGVHNIYKFVLRPDALPLRNELQVSVAPPNGSNGHADGGEGNGAANEPAGQTREAILNIAIAPLISKELQQIGRLIIFDDITDRSELERRLVQADKLSSIGLLAAGVAHEVNTPLAVISTYAQMLAKQITGDDSKNKLLDKIARQTFRASEIVNSLLNFSRTSPTEFVDVDLNRVIRDTLNLIEHQLLKTRVQVDATLEDRLPPIRGNTGKLQQVFLNLFLNARDAMEGGGVLKVRTWSEAGAARVDVTDTGQGIAPENLARIYDPFFTTKAHRKGTGLGLSVTYGIVKEHGGAIEVESQPGAGTRFHLDLPLARTPVNA